MRTLIFPLLFCAALAAQEMNSANFRLDRSAFINAGGSSAGDLLLTDRFGAANFGRMESSRFRIGAGVEWMAGDEGALPTEFALGPNFPNPFNSSTVIAFSLPQPCEIEVAVYSTLGRLAAVLVREYKDAGHYRLRYDGVDDRGYLLPSGVYFCRLSTKGFDKTIKFAILR